MELRIMSDLHLEFDVYDKHSIFQVPDLANDKDRILVLAGDIGIPNKKGGLKAYLEFLQICSSQFKHVVLVLGNHEYWYGSILRTPEKMQVHIEELKLDNVHLLNNSIFKVPDKNLVFLGTTLWVSGNMYNPICGMNWSVLRDSRVIRHGSKGVPYQRKFSFRDMVSEHYCAKYFLKEETREQKEKGNKVVWVTHHPPSRKSVPLRFKDNPLSDLFAAQEMEYEILHLEPDLCIHGHIHDNCDYLVGENPGIRVLCNPRGYFGSELNSEFNSELIVEI